MPPTSAPVQERPVAAADAVGAPARSITITPDGPYVVRGGVDLAEQVITPVEGHLEYRTARTYPRQEVYALCRCGHTSTPPYCDGAHAAVGFDGTETASRAPFAERAEVYRGEGVTLLDDNRCAYARFCHREEGNVWSLTERSEDEHLKREAVKASSDCPAGRLVHIDAEENTAYEPRLAPSITLLEDPLVGASGPLFVRGGVALISADGSAYELRNRYALCRCGESRNKPFCDAMHVTVQYQDGLEDFEGR